MTVHSEAGAGGLRAPGGYSLQVAENVVVGDLAQHLEHLTFPSLRARLRAQEVGPGSPLHAVAASAGGEPVGLALAKAGPGSGSAEVVSLYVRRDHRGRGLSLPLLVGLEKCLARRGCRRLRLAFRSDWPARPVIERRLRHLGWSEPVANLTLAKFHVPDAHAAWSSSAIANAELPGTFTVGPWGDLGADERRRLLAKCEPAYPGELAPVEPGALAVEPLNSLVLRHRGEVAGWIVTHRLDTQTVQYTRLQVQPGFRRLGRGLTLLAEAVRLQVEAGVPFGVFQVRSDNAAMQRLVARRLRPFLCTCVQSLRSEKPVAPMEN